MANLGKIISTFLAALIGGLSVLAGGSVLVNITAPNYQFLEWLVVYNVVLGLASLLVAFKLWQAANYKLPAAILISHIATLALLLTVFSKEVAGESLRAMSFRMLIWTIVLFITYLRNKNEN